MAKHGGKAPVGFPTFRKLIALLAILETAEAIDTGEPGPIIGDVFYGDRR
jgi:hypothetical protein